MSDREETEASSPQSANRHFPHGKQHYWEGAGESGVGNLPRGAPITNCLGGSDRRQLPHRMGLEPGDQYQMAHFQRHQQHPSTTPHTSPSQQQRRLMGPDHGPAEEESGESTSAEFGPHSSWQTAGLGYQATPQQRKLPIIGPIGAVRSAYNEQTHSSTQRQPIRLPGQPDPNKPRSTYILPPVVVKSATDSRIPPKSPAELNMYSDRIALPRRPSYSGLLPKNPGQPPRGPYVTYTLPPIDPTTLEARRRGDVKPPRQPIPPQAKDISMPSAARAPEFYPNETNPLRGVIHAQPGNVPLSDSEDEIEEMDVSHGSQSHSRQHEKARRNEDFDSESEGSEQGQRPLPHGLV